VDRVLGKVHRQFGHGWQFAPWLSGEAGAKVLKPAPNDFLQRWPVSKRVNSSKADADDATLIEPVEATVA
jgi:putative SOS response-associated peptidase YedK